MIAITGAGEYLDIIRPYDEILLNKLKDDPYVVCFPTAAGLESNERIQYWLDLGDDHFSKLNVNHKSMRALNVDDYNKPETLAEIEKANFVYFSGGNPNHLYETLSSSLAWEKLLTIHLPNQCAGFVLPRSGLASKHKITLINSPGLVDPGYTGEFMVPLINHGSADYQISIGDRIAQLVLINTNSVKFKIVDNLPDTERSTGGFGSTD
jgi:deoxyuridine 5'-triphosphate nucleotidohydrolase